MVLLPRFYGIDGKVWISFILISFGYLVIALILYCLLSLLSLVKTENLKLRIVLDNAKNVPFYFLGILFFCLVPLGPYFYMYRTNNIIPFFICESFIALSYLLFIFTLVFLMRSKNDELIIILRKTALILLLLSWIISIIVVYILPLFSIFGLTTSPNKLVSTPPSLLYTLSCRSYDGLIIVVWWILTYQIGCGTSGNSEKYLLYLRSFKYDKKWESEMIAEQLKSAVPNWLQIKRIGNPKTIFSLNTHYNTIYLDDVDWKKDLADFIANATVVFCVVDDTEGLFWEMFNHIDRINNYIFYIENRAKCADLIRKIEQNKDYEDNILSNAFKSFVNKSPKKYDKDVYLFYMEREFYIMQSLNQILEVKASGCKPIGFESNIYKL